MANMNYFSDTVNSIVRSGDFSGKDHGNIPFTDAQKKNVPDYAKNYTFKSTQERDKKYSQLQGKGGKKDKGKGTQTQTQSSRPNFIQGLDSVDESRVPEYAAKADFYNKDAQTVEYVTEDGTAIPNTTSSLLGKYYTSKVKAATSKYDFISGSYRRQTQLDNSKLETAKSEDKATQAENKLKKTRSKIERRVAKDAEKDRQSKREKGVLGFYAGRLNTNVGSVLDSASTLYDTIDSGLGKLDTQIFGPSTVGKTSKSRKAVDKILEAKPSTGPVDSGVYASLAKGKTLTSEEYDLLNSKQKKLYDKAAKSDEDARTTARSRKIRSAVQTTGDVVGAAKDTISSKSRARTLAERGLVGEKRRDARIAYALGDRSLGTKLAAGRSLGSKNAFTRFIGRFPAWATYGRRENKNRKNYAKQLAYSGGFSEGEIGVVLGLLTSHDFSENEDLMNKTTGEGWQYREYPELVKLIDDDKYEKMDQSLIEKGEFSELDQVDETPQDAPIVNSSDIAQHTATSEIGEVSISNILNKNYYEASPLEKKFQEMAARGFSEDEPRTYEDLLQTISDGADMMRRV